MADSQETKEVEMVPSPRPETANLKLTDLRTMDTNGEKPTLEMSIYDFIEYLTKEKNIYIDIKQFKRQLKNLKGKHILTVG
tara:strand:+ start:85 stop:327 length:243 start_codon:yes stop_codon:yes gene_type:complete